MIITTSLRTTKQITEKAKQVAAELGLQFFQRNQQPIPVLFNDYNCDILVVGSDRISLYQQGYEKPFFFHPNSAMFRVKRFFRGEVDPFLKATKLTNNMTILDCTLGLASDSILSSVAVGKSGQVVGLEASCHLAYIVSKGLHSWKTGLAEVDDAMQRINVIHRDNLDYLCSAKANSFDVVYFDPMFEVKIDASDGISPLRRLALYDHLKEEAIEEAKRVAKHRVVLKDHFQSARFSRFNFSVYKRVTAQFHYGSIEL
jgi:hypothetical protein